MASFNQVILLGNLTRDPQLRYIPSSNTPVVDFGIACNRRFKAQNGEDREEVTFVDCSAFAKQAELINQYFTKGKPIFIQGRLKLDQWEDKQGGGKRSKLSVVVEQFQFVGGRDGGGGGGGGGGGQYDQSAGGGGGEYDQRPAQRGPQQNRGPAAPQRGAQNAPPPQQPFGDEENFKEDDIPF
ncbi:MAG TPA: single-stranded DNA-binding protein [Tepidisphaeraceae bacterium]|jgi:single-strand DNA-binding protein